MISKFVQEYVGYANDELKLAQEKSFFNRKNKE